MEENKKRMNPWVPAVVMGVIAILFSFYALQSQAELQEARGEIERLKIELGTVQTMAEQNAAQAKRERDVAVFEAAQARAEAEKCMQSKQRK